MMFVTVDGVWSVADPYSSEALKVIVDAVGAELVVVQLTSVLAVMLGKDSADDQNLFVQQIAHLYGAGEGFAFRGPAVLIGGIIPSTGAIAPLNTAHVSRSIGVIKEMKATAAGRKE